MVGLYGNWPHRTRGSKDLEKLIAELVIQAAGNPGQLVGFGGDIFLIAILNNI